MWAYAAKEVKPLGGKSAVLDLEPEPLDQPAGGERPARISSPARGSPAPVLPPLAPLEPKTRIGLRRGTRRVDAAIDLHGLRQAEAHRALRSFLVRSQARGDALVLVITGKGASSGPGLFEERGVLRRVVPDWLRLPDLRPLILGFEEATPHHGGAGALYVRLRRRPSSGWA